MSRYVAFLRGINVGSHRVTMDHLRSLFEALGHTDVWTFIASGNVGFSCDVGDRPLIRNQLERHLALELGYEVATFLRTPAEVRAIADRVEHLRFGGGPGKASGTWETPATLSLYVLLLQEAPSAELQHRLLDLCPPTDAFAFSEREIYWRIRGKLSGSPLFGGTLDRALGSTPVTMRNLTTLRRLVTRLEV